MNKRPSDAQEHYTYGKVYFYRGEPEKALEEFQAALEIDPENPALLRCAGESLIELNKYEQAMEYLGKGLRLSPEFADLHYFMGCAFIALGKKESAINELKEALNINPRYASAMKKLNNLLISQDKLEKNAEPAEEEEIATRRANMHLHLGNALARKNLLREALEEYKEAIRLRPDYPDVHNRMGELHLKSGDFEVAKKEFETAIEMNPRYVGALLNLADARMEYAEKLVEEAEKDYRSALEINTNSKRAGRGLEKVRSMKGEDFF